MPKNYIPITEYQEPNYTATQHEIARPREIANKAHTIIAKGYKFTTQRFALDEVWFGIFDIQKDELPAFTICCGNTSKRAMYAKFDKLVNAFWDKHLGPEDFSVDECMKAEEAEA